MSKVEDMFDEMLEAQCEQMAKEKKELEEMENKENMKETKEATENVLKRFLSYIKSIRFNNRCKLMARKHNLSHCAVKNIFIKSILQKIADILHLTITITAEIISGVAEFICSIINKITFFCKETCIKITTLLTLNCGSYDIDDEFVDC